MIFGNLGNMAEMMKQAQKMKSELDRVKNELKHAKYEVEENGVKVVINGEMEIKEIRISRLHQGFGGQAGNQDIRKMEEAVKHTINSALSKAKDDAASKLKSATGGISIPGLT